MQYFEARYYSPDTGRFYSQDRVFWELGNTKRGVGVLQDPQQLNAYAYARNNPLVYVDPSGEIIETGWDLANVAYDAGRGIKNTGELIGGGLAYGVGAYTNNQYLKDAALNGIKGDLRDLGEVGIDTGTDALAAMIPFVPAGGSKAARGIAKMDITGFKKLEKHFKDHGSDFGAKDPSEYYKKAEDFLGGTKGGGVLEKINKHGDSIIRYDPKNNIFGSVNKENGIIRTFFKPKGNGKDYFNNQ